MSTPTLRDATADDAPALCAIYNPYIEQTVISFEQTPVTVPEMRARLAQISGLGYPWLVATEATGAVLGYAYANAWKARAAYRHSVEVTVYLDRSATARGLGTALYAALFARLKAHGGIHAVVACIALPNAHSVALHEKFGMRQAGIFKEVGFKFGQWQDVGYWQCLLHETTPVAPL